MTATWLLALLIVVGEWTGLARGLLGAPYLAGALDVVLIGLATVVGVNALRQRRLWPVPILAVLVFAYMGLAAIQIFNPNVPGVVVGMEGYRKTAFTMLAFFVVYFGRTGDPHRFFRVVAVGSIPAFLWAIRQAFVPLPIDMAIIDTTHASPISFHSGAVLRAFAPTAGPFHLGILAATVMIIALVWYSNGSRWWVALACLAGISLGLTITRANLAAATAALLLVASLSRSWRGRVTSIMAAAPALAAAALAVLLAVGALSFPSADVTPGDHSIAPGVAGQPTATLTPSPSTRPDVGDVVGGVMDPLEDRSLQFRFEFWREYLVAIGERPLIGYGTSSAADGFDHLYAGTGSRNFEPHSLYFKAALELGVLGLVLLLAILVLAAYHAFKAIAVDRPPALIAIGFGVVITVTGLTGPMLDAYPANTLFWATLGWVTRATSRPAIT